MATITYAEYVAQQEKRKQAAERAANGGNTQKASFKFMGEFLPKSGSQIIVRFPFKSEEDIQIERVHIVEGSIFGTKFGKAVRCTGEKDCPLCNSDNPDYKKRANKFYFKFIAYPTIDGKVVPTATVWERPAAFADIELKTIMQDNPDLTEILVRVTRSGEGTGTRYTLVPVTNKSIYSDAVYKPEFELLEGIDPVKICSKDMSQYLKAVNPEAEATDAAKVEDASELNSVQEAAEAFTSVNTTTEDTKPTETSVEEVTPTTTQAGKTTKYRF